MSRPALLNSDEIEKALGALLGWRVENDALCKTFKFKDFKKAFAFMTACAEISEDLDHHPDWRNVYSSVEVKLSTHDTADKRPGLTKLDIEWATRAQALEPTL
jgi:4a-hydroxytetrahydrobiopterin dehydratase